MQAIGLEKSMTSSLTGVSLASCLHLLLSLYTQAADVPASGTCESQPCKHNGTCQVVTSGYKCNCLPGFYGTICEYGPKDCHEIISSSPESKSGVYKVVIGTTPRDVYCEIVKGEAWTVIQRRQDGLVDFNRPWGDYAAGFGDPAGEYWIGNDALATLTPTALYSLHITMRDRDGESAYALYDHFRVDDALEKYNLTSLGSYSGTAGDSLSSHLRLKFTTKDEDNDWSDYNCAERWHGGWWFNACLQSNLNGDYNGVGENMGIIWKTWRGFSTSLTFTEMKIHPVYVV